MANVSSTNLTTLYSGSGVNVRPTSAYGNANVVSLLNAGTDGGNTVTNIVATGNLTVDFITANSNVTADYFIGNLIGNTSNANYANFAGTAFNVSGSNVSGDVAGANHANIADVANTVAGANVSGEVAFAAVANSVAGANVSGEVSFAAVANSVAIANVVGIGNIATINLDGNVSNILHGDGSFGPESGNLNANYANFAGNVTISAQPNITSLGTLVSLNVSGNANISNSLIMSGPTAGQPDIVGVNDGSTSQLRGILINSGYSSSPNLASGTSGGTTTINGGAAWGNTDTGAVWNATSGILQLSSGAAYTANGNATSQQLLFGTGTAVTDKTGRATSGAINVTGGLASANANTANSGDITFRTGQAITNTSGIARTGNINLQIGNANGVSGNTAGNINIGTSSTGTNSAPTSINIGVTTTPTIINSNSLTVGNGNGIITTSRVNLSGQPGGAIATTINNVVNCPDITFNRYDNNAYINNYSVYRARGTSTSPTDVQPGDTLFQIYNSAYSNSSAPFAPTGTFSSTVNTNDNAGNITINTSYNASIPTGSTFTIGYGQTNIQGNLQTVNANLGNLAYANFFQGDGYLISNLTVAGGTQIVNGNTNVSALANSNVTFDIAGVSNVLVITNSGADLVGTFTSNVANFGDLYVNNSNIHLGTNTGLPFQGLNGIAIGNGAAGGGTSVTHTYVDYDYANNILTLDDTSSIIVGMTINGTGFDGTQIVFGLIDSTTVNADPPLSTPSGNLTFSSGQAANSISIGANAGYILQQYETIAIGSNAGSNSQEVYSIALGANAGSITQRSGAVAIGLNAGSNNQGSSAFAMGANAGVTNQGTGAVAVGQRAGLTSQGTNSIAFGVDSGQVSQGGSAVALGPSAGQTSQGANSIAIGAGSGRSTQGTNSIAIGRFAGNNSQGANAIAIGRLAGNASQATNSIILNATGAVLNQTTANTFTVKPVRNIIASNAVFYNTTTGEISYDTLANNTSNVGAGNITVTTNINGSSSNVGNTQLSRFQETVYSIGSTSGTITPDFVNGSIQTMTLTGSITLNSLGNAVAGRSMTLIITQGGSGGYTLTSSMLFSNGYKILSPSAGATDIISVFYDGTNYYASLTNGYV